MGPLRARALVVRYTLVCYHLRIPTTQMQHPTRPPDFDTKHLTALFMALMRRVEKLEGSVAQLRAEANHPTRVCPTPRQTEELQHRLALLEARLLTNSR